MTKCNNCDHLVLDSYCGHCGQAVKLKRIDRKYVLHEIVHVLHIEKGIFYTIKELILRPGKSVNAFISENRNRLVKPVIFIIVTSLIYSIISHWFIHVEVQPHTPEERSIIETVSVIFDWIQHHYGYANMILGVFIALWLKLFFRKYGYNFFEILILLCFIMGIGMLLLTLSAIIEGLSGLHIARITEFLSLIYFSWAIGQFFNKKKIGSYFVAFGAYLLGMVSYYLLLVILCVIIVISKA